jgi:hypothetical protein
MGLSDIDLLTLLVEMDVNERSKAVQLIAAISGNRPTPVAPLHATAPRQAMSTKYCGWVRAKPFFKSAQVEITSTRRKQVNPMFPRLHVVLVKYAVPKSALPSVMGWRPFSRNSVENKGTCIV